MKPFDLQRALSGDKVVTRDGREVTQLHKLDAKGECLVGVIDQFLHIWFESGAYLGGNKKNNDLDLFMAPKTVKRWVNFYADGDAFYYDCEHDAIKHAAHHAIAIAVPVEFEEGYGCNE